MLTGPVLSEAPLADFRGLRIGPIEIDRPVVLAPMAGVTNPPFRSLCRRFGAGLYVGEMVGARSLVEGRDHPPARIVRCERVAPIDSALWHECC